MNSAINMEEDTFKKEHFVDKETETKVTLQVDQEDLDDKEPEMFKDRQAEMGWCKHGTPKLENGLMRCPFCGEVATEIEGVFQYED